MESIPLLSKYNMKHIWRNFHQIIFYCKILWVYNILSSNLFTKHFFETSKRGCCIVFGGFYFYRENLKICFTFV